MTTLPERLLEMCRTPDGRELPDHAEPWGADVATLREAAQALQAAPEGGEAVAWLWLLNGKPMNVFLHRPSAEADHWTAKGFSVAPLYASPAQPSGFVLVPDHYDANIAYAACVLEQSVCAIDRLNAPPLRKLVSLMRKKPNAAAAPAPIEQEG